MDVLRKFQTNSWRTPLKRPLSISPSVIGVRLQLNSKNTFLKLVSSSTILIDVNFWGLKSFPYNFPQNTLLRWNLLLFEFFPSTLKKRANDIDSRVLSLIFIKFWTRINLCKELMCRPTCWNSFNFPGKFVFCGLHRSWEWLLLVFKLTVSHHFQTCNISSVCNGELKILKCS